VVSLVVLSLLLAVLCICRSTVVLLGGCGCWLPAMRSFPSSECWLLQIDMYVYFSYVQEELV
jgi:hypothetical protein